MTSEEVIRRIGLTKNTAANNQKELKFWEHIMKRLGKLNTYRTH